MVDRTGPGVSSDMHPCSVGLESTPPLFIESFLPVSAITNIFLVERHEYNHSRSYDREKRYQRQFCSRCEQTCHEPCAYGNPKTTDNHKSQHNRHLHHSMIFAFQPFHRLLAADYTKQNYAKSPTPPIPSAKIALTHLCHCNHTGWSVTIPPDASSLQHLD